MTDTTIGAPGAPNPHLLPYAARGLKGRILSGVQPTGNLHLGNYLGAIRNFARLQNDYECLYCVVDQHAITVPQDPKMLAAQTREIASAFLADIRLGVIAAVSVLAHEVPHHMGDLVVLRQTSPNRRMALVKVSLAGAVTALGGVVGYFLVGQLQDFLPYFLAVASSSFVYVALADLIPQLQKRLTARETIAQIAWLIAGMVIVTLVSGAAHAH